MIINRLSKNNMAMKVFDMCSQIRSKTAGEAASNTSINLMKDTKRVGKMHSFSTLPSGQSQAVEILNKKGNISAVVRVYSDGRYVVQDKPALKSNKSILKSANKMLSDVLNTIKQAESTATVKSYTPGTAEYTEMLSSYGVEPGYYERAMAAYNKYMKPTNNGTA